MTRKAAKQAKPKGLGAGDVTRVTAYLPADLAQSVRVQAATEGRTVSSVVSAALERAVREPR